MQYIIISADSTQSLQQEVNIFRLKNPTCILHGGPFYDNHGYHQAVETIIYGEKQILKD